MSEYGKTKLARMMIDDRPDEEKIIEMAEKVWRERGGAYFNLDDPQLSPMHKSIIEQIAIQRYGRRQCR